MMTVTEAIAYIAELQARPGMIADSRRVLKAAAVLAAEIEWLRLQLADSRE